MSEKIQVPIYGDDIAKLDVVRAEMARRKVPFRKGGNEYTASHVVSWLIQEFPELLRQRGGREATGTGDAVLEKINAAVTAQIELNRATTATVTVGRGKNQVTVRYQQRAITPRWIREKCSVNADAVADYLAKHGADVAAHNEWLVANCGYETDTENYNRRTSKAEIKATGGGGAADDGDEDGE